MTTAVPTNGFTVPSVQPASPAPASPTPAPTPTPAPAPAPAQPAAAPGLEEAIRSLTAAFQAQPASPVQPAADLTPNPVKDVGDLNAVDVSGLEDPLLQSMAVALRIGAPKDLDMNRVLGLALERGDPALIDKAYLVEKFGAEAAHRIRIAEGIVQSVNAQVQQGVSAVHEAAGSKEAWAASAAAFNQTAPAELRAVVAQMLDSGNIEFIRHASKLVVEYSKANGLVPNANPLVTAGGAQASAQALTKGGFQAELRKLDPNAPDYQAKRQDLFARRALGKQLGLAD